VFSKTQIRGARKTLLAPLLIQRGYRLHHTGDDNYAIISGDSRIPDDIVIKESYWISKSRNLSGNAIDFFVMLEGLPFYKAVEIIANADAITPTDSITQSQPGNNPKSLRQEFGK
jgi:hypothetical protein